jgi:nicotinate-nucleotide pyrophosphorylase (carboxylating)
MTPRRESELAAHGFCWEEALRFPLTKKETTALVATALEEDDAKHDITTAATVLSDRRARCRLVARQTGVISGLTLAREAFEQLDKAVTMRTEHEDGTRINPETPVMFLSGHARGLLSAERVALNFMQRLSGIATLTARYVEAIAGTGAHILDTRKTTPGWRRLEKYAVRCGGGLNHRMDLSSAVLIKDNHLAAVDGDIALAVKRARGVSPEGVKIEVECDRLDQVGVALEAGADVIMLDNMGAIDRRDGSGLDFGWGTDPLGAGARSRAGFRLMAEETCDVCGSTNIKEIKCKLVCQNCGTILRSCADLGAITPSIEVNRHGS